MKAYVSFHPAHPETYAFRVAQRFACLLIISIFISCGSVHKIVKVEATQQLEEYKERGSKRQSIFELLDSLAWAHSLEADSLELEIYTSEVPEIGMDSLAASRPPRPDASGRLSAKLTMKGIRSNTQLTHTQTAYEESLSEDTASSHRISHEEVMGDEISEKEVKPPNTFRNLAFLVMAVAILLGVLLIAVGKLKGGK